MFAQVDTCTPVISPSFLSAIRATVTWSRPCESVIDDSVRVATHLVGRLIFRATHGVMTSSG